MTFYIAVAVIIVHFYIIVNYRDCKEKLMEKSNKELQDENKKLLEVLERINKAYDKGGLQAKYTKEMRSALTKMKIVLLTNVI